MPYYYTPYRQEYNEGDNAGCPFCDKEKFARQVVQDSKGQVVGNEHYTWWINWYPKCEGHTMIISRRHIEKLEEETEEEVAARHKLTLHAISTLRRMYSHEGIIVFLQNGRGGGGTQKHLHWHVMPDFPDDPLPSIGKVDYFHTGKPNEKKIILSPIKIRLAREELHEALKKHIIDSWELS